MRAELCSQCQLSIPANATVYQQLQRPTMSPNPPSLIESREDLLGKITHQPTRDSVRSKRRCLLGIY
ncbi:MAG: hypothetical protein FE78DRAFT_326092 [Acidomyces sp. 'richmondensis']|nr:MAG: hypothetical protein FE78DRAFT_326092 [Acidomyces sp. 'richmondensis']